MKNQPHHQECPFCQWVQNKPEYAIEENESFLSLTNISPDTEGHVLIITKESRTNISELTLQEWESFLKILQSTINKLNIVLGPQGFNIYSNSGAEGAARQAVFHFHFHITPEWKGNRGVGYLRKPWFIPSVEKYQEINEVLRTKKGIIEENDRAISQLIEREQASDYGHIIISSKNLKNNDINEVDKETWKQIGQLLQESIARIEKNLDLSSFRTIFFLGEIGGIKERSNQLQIHLIPRYKPQGHAAKEVIPIPSEVLELAEELRKINDKQIKFQEQEECQQELVSVTENIDYKN
ncbi:MAG: hypothetical protein mread185_000346 [Mycoplasmataceae bacterium]|nr:MAG: hypothetical protein mread185_000346 [Mycoplasmataceae bacterium]